MGGREFIRLAMPVRRPPTRRTTNFSQTELADVPLERRSAHYTCHVVLADPAGQIVARTEAYCHGRIRFEPVGTAGFGYDPLFEIVEYHRTFAELGLAVKRVLSHRSRAVRQLVELLTSRENGSWNLFKRFQEPFSFLAEFAPRGILGSYGTTASSRRGRLRLPRLEPRQCSNDDLRG